MTNLETNLLKVLTHEAICFCSRVVRLFPALLAQMHTALIRPSYGTFLNGFAKKALAGPYGLYDKRAYLRLCQHESIYKGKQMPVSIVCKQSLDN